MTDPEPGLNPTPTNQNPEEIAKAKKLEGIRLAKSLLANFLVGVSGTHSRGGDRNHYLETAFKQVARDLAYVLVKRKYFTKAQVSEIVLLASRAGLKKAVDVLVELSKNKNRTHQPDDEMEHLLFYHVSLEKEYGAHDSFHEKVQNLLDNIRDRANARRSKSPGGSLSKEDSKALSDLDNADIEAFLVDVANDPVMAMDDDATINDITERMERLIASAS